MEFRQWKCSVCGYIYSERDGNPSGGISPGTHFEDLPSDWECPSCGAPKEDFELVEE